MTTQETIMKARIWVLGAPDPEMEAIEDLLREAGETVLHATVAGVRVHPGNAYRADVPPEIMHSDLVPVECAWWASDEDRPDLVIDHHRPGDPGYGRPPAEYWEASSLGQVVSILRTEGGNHGDLPNEYTLTAAADHCLAAAYRGECPGVDPDTLMGWRIETRATYRGCDPADLLATVERTRQTLRDLWDGQRDRGYVLLTDPLPECPEAAAREGIPFCAPVTDRDGRRKLVLQCAPPDIITHWMQRHRESGHEVYGDPARGFAGAYVSRAAAG